MDTNECAVLPVGTYYIGDLCYIMTEDEWDEVIDLCFPASAMQLDMSSGLMTLKDGRVFGIWSTKHGDGLYTDNSGRSYPVDSGTIGIINVNNIKNDRFDEQVCRGLGHVIEFDSSLNAICNQGIFKFEDQQTLITINTDEFEVQDEIV